jgi:hypothetical protein
MFFQKVLKGIPDIDPTTASNAFHDGIICNWWHRVGVIRTAEILDKLNEDNLDWHLNRYADRDPVTGRPFSESTPFISATAGVVERATFLRANLVFDPFEVALRFATRNFTTTGCIYHAYVYTLGKPSLELREFAEEVRELNIYKWFLPFHPEGEVTAKIEIRGPQIEGWEAYDGPTSWNFMWRGMDPVPTASATNPLYAPPERFCNIRGLITD